MSTDTKDVLLGLGLFLGGLFGAGLVLIALKLIADAVF